MRESTIVAKIMKAVKQKYPKSYCRKLADRFTRALPDILIQLPVEFKQEKSWPVLISATLFVETKTLKGRAAKLQELERELILAAGGHHCFARDVETVMAELERLGAC